MLNKYFITQCEIYIIKAIEQIFKYTKSFFCGKRHIDFPLS